MKCKVTLGPFKFIEKAPLDFYFVFLVLPLFTFDFSFRFVAETTYFTTVKVLVVLFVQHWYGAKSNAYKKFIWAGRPSVKLAIEDVVCSFWFASYVVVNMPIFVQNPELVKTGMIVIFFMDNLFSTVLAASVFTHFYRRLARSQ